MKRVIVISVLIIGGLNIWQHSIYQENVLQGVTKILKEKGYNNVEEVGIRLPYSLTFLAKEVTSDVFLKFGEQSERIKVTVTPMGSLPFLGIFFDTRLQYELSGEEMFRLQRYIVEK